MACFSQQGVQSCCGNFERTYVRRECIQGVVSSDCIYIHAVSHMVLTCGWNVLRYTLGKDSEMVFRKDKLSLTSSRI